METTFSPDQLKAIENRDRTLLVSAAAGSGKTTTLTERIIRSLLDEDKPESLQNMLIVTFTNTAVADLEAKIQKALTIGVKENPDNHRLEEELYLLPSAKIRTIDSFCGEILRANADRVGVNPSYRIAESAEVSMLTKNILDSLINSAYNGELSSEGISAPDFETLADSLTNAKRESELATVFEAIYEKCKNSIDGVKIFDALSEIYKKDNLPAEQLPYCSDIMAYTKRALEHYADKLNATAYELTPGTEAEERYAEYLKRVSELIKGAYRDKYSELRISLDIGYPTAPRTASTDKTEAFDIAHSRYEKIKKSIKGLCEKFFQYSEEDWHNLLASLYKSTSTLSKFLQVFDRVFMGEKLRRAILEYSDIERLAYKCLYDENGEFTDIARAYQNTFSSIYIDEYQDVNELQDAIFLALSNGKNRFMVGDIKQSIYVFRSAKPKFFSDMKKSFPPLDKAKEGESATIFMSENFRCDKGIVEFVNSIFDKLFNVTRDSIGYVDDDRLKYAKVYESGICPDEIPSIYLLDRKEKIDEEPEVEDEAPTMSARFVASEILKLLKDGRLADGERIKPSNIAIILRSRTHLNEYKDALIKEGIPTDTGEDKTYFMNAEVRLALSLLGAIDNPERDVKLTALMCSPLFSFSIDELLKYRLYHKGGSFYRAIKEFSKAHPEDEKLSSFLSRLHYYRTISEGLSVDKLIARLYDETGILSLGDSKKSKTNLTMLWAFARKFEGSSYKGLYNFLTYIDTIVKSGGTIAERSAIVSDSAVTITTSHSSKGLEFPIVFFVECGRPIGGAGPDKPPFSYLEDYGISFSLRDSEGVVQCENPVSKIIDKKLKIRELEEELRVLYVTLTRAREKLFIVADLPHNKTYDEFISSARLNTNSLSAFSLETMPTFADWILACEPKANIINVKWEDEPEEEVSTPIENENSEKREVFDESLINILRERFSFTYKNEAETHFPEKLSVSHLSPAVLDGATDNAISIEAIKEEKEPSLPTFISGIDDEYSAKCGIATHLFLQFCDLDYLKENGVSQELSRLSDMGFIPRDMVELVRVDELSLFLSSKLFSDMRGAKRLYREFRFNSRLDASPFTSDEGKKESLIGKKILVQGVIDCIIEDEFGELHLIDYKTDRLTKRELQDPSLAREKLKKRHYRQLSYYALACKEVFGKYPKTISVYSLPLGLCLEM